MCPWAGEDGREYTIAYYKRDTRRGVDWNYKDAEGALAPTTPFKYMDGTPFLKQYKLREELPSQCPVMMMHVEEARANARMCVCMCVCVCVFACTCVHSMWGSPANIPNIAE